LPIDVVISPEREVAEAALRRLASPAAFDTESFLGLFAPSARDQLFAEDEVYLATHREDVARALEIFGKAQKKQERVVILGGGNVGLAVARALEARTERIRAKVIEKNRHCAELAADALERTIVLNGDGLNVELLREANVSKADAVLAVTDDDKTNMLAAVRAKAEGARFTPSATRRRR